MTRKRVPFALLVLILFSVAACGSKEAENVLDAGIIHNPASAEGYDDSAKVPVMTFEKDMHDFGRLSAGENISYSFKFTNTGKSDLVISGFDTSCGCTVADYPKERIKPGESGYVTVSFRSAGKSGQQFQEVTVTSNAKPAKVKLKIHAEVR